jgi:hypothetical protein
MSWDQKRVGPVGGWLLCYGPPWARSLDFDRADRGRSQLWYRLFCGVRRLVRRAYADKLPSFGVQRLAQNWHGPGESDCLIKTKHCDVH